MGAKNTTNSQNNVSKDECNKHIFIFSNFQK